MSTNLAISPHTPTHTAISFLYFKDIKVFKDFKVPKVFRDFRDLKDLKDTKDLDSGMDWCDELVWAATKWEGEGWIREKIAKFAIQAF